jgi:hypothetical protein
MLSLSEKIFKNVKIFREKYAHIYLHKASDEGTTPRVLIIVIPAATQE